MDKLTLITEKLVKYSKDILKDNLIGVYLHGSAAMGCFNEKTSDIDMLIVIDKDMSDAEKRQYMDMVVGLNIFAPEKGIELSIVKKSVCKPFVYPTPFELHFSIAHLEWYKNTPQDYILKMNGTDKDLAAHIMIIYHRGLCLYGEEIRSIFEDVGREAYFDSIWNDVKQAEEDIMDAPVYVTLNLCRVLAYKQEDLILSKQEGGEWGLKNVPEKYSRLIQKALDEYGSVSGMNFEEKEAKEYVKYMIDNISD